MNPDLARRLSHSPSALDLLFFDLLAKKYATHAPAPVDVKLEEINSEDDDSGYCTFDGERFLIIIDPRLDFGSRCDLLLHEAAHTIAPWDDEEDHDDAWGIAYAALYREYLALYDWFYFEEWRDVTGYKGYYQVSNFGRIRRVKLGAPRSGSTGAYKAGSKWSAQIRVNGECLYLGLFDSEKDAARAYREAAKKYRSPSILNPCVGSTGAGSEYLQVGLAKRGKTKSARVHTLVAEAFLGPRPDGLVVCHGPAGQLCNHIANLRYATESSNQADRRKQGTAGKPVTNDLGETFINANEAEEITGIDRRLIDRVCKGQLRTTHGRTWAYGAVAPKRRQPHLRQDRSNK